MSRHSSIVTTHKDGASRCRQLCDLYSYGLTQYPAQLDSTDILRSSVVMIMSSLDLLIHSLYLNEVRHRLSNGIQIKSLVIPFNSLVLGPAEAAAAIDSHISNNHSYKSFIAPDKISEVICHFIDNPFVVISQKLGLPEKDVKIKLKELVRWRNRIAHEADINPELGGIELWPIFESDVRTAIDFIERLGEIIVEAVTEQS